MNPEKSTRGRAGVSFSMYERARWLTLRHSLAEDAHPLQTYIRNGKSVENGATAKYLNGPHSAIVRTLFDNYTF